MPTGYELDWAQPLQAGFQMGLRLQEQRQAKRDRERMIALSNSRLELERQQENRLKEQQFEILKERELDRRKAEATRIDSARFPVDVDDALRAGATPLQARAMAGKLNPFAEQTRESIDEFIPKPAPRVTPINFGDADVLDINGRVISNPEKSSAPAAVRTARAVADAEIAAGRATEEDRAAIEADNMKKQDPVIRRSTQVVDTMIKGGLLEPSQKDKTIAEMAENGGKILKPNETTILKLGERVATLDMADQLDKDLTSFDEKFGKGSLDSYIGRFDVPLNQAFDIMRKRKTPQDVEALRIFQNFQDIKNGKIKTVSGATVTADEGKRADAAIGSVLNKNFVNQFRNFRSNERGTFKATVDTLEGYKLPKNVLAAAGKPVEAEASVTVEPLRVSSQAEYDALKPGDRFIDGTGKVKTKRAK